MLKKNLVKYFKNYQFPTAVIRYQFKNQCIKINCSEYETFRLENCLKKWAAHLFNINIKLFLTFYLIKWT